MEERGGVEEGGSAKEGGGLDEEELEEPTPFTRPHTK